MEASDAFNEEYALPELRPIKDKGILDNVHLLKLHIGEWKNNLIKAKTVLRKVTQSNSLPQVVKTQHIEKCNNYIKNCEFNVALYERVLPRAQFSTSGAPRMLTQPRTSPPIIQSTLTPQEIMGDQVSKSKKQQRVDKRKHVKEILQSPRKRMYKSRVDFENEFCIIPSSVPEEDQQPAVPEDPLDWHDHSSHEGSPEVGAPQSSRKSTFTESQSDDAANHTTVMPQQFSGPQKNQPEVDLEVLLSTLVRIEGQINSVTSRLDNIENSIYFLAGQMK